jgi:lipoate-protein ligase A
MGVDEALLATATAGGGPTLRFYGWDGPWLSLGYGQPETAERLEACAAAGVGVVRRATGGRAVLHGGDLTYAVAAPEALLPAGLEATYRLISGALASALGPLGVDVTPGPEASPAGALEGFDCFAQRGADALCAGGRKLVGSAQRRGGAGVLQHGSIRRAPDPESARQAAGLGPEASTSLQELGCSVSARDLREACIEALAAALDARFSPGRLLPAESRQAAQRGRLPRRNDRNARDAIPAGIQESLSATDR